MNIPDEVSQQVVKEVLNLVGDSNWNDLKEIPSTFARVMSLDLTKPLNEQIAVPNNIKRTILVPSRNDSKIPFWIFQSFVKMNSIEFNGINYNKIDIIFSDYFKKKMDTIAFITKCTWNVRWGGASKKENRLYRKLHSKNECSWIDLCTEHLLSSEDSGLIDINNLIMIEFKRKL